MLGSVHAMRCEQEQREKESARWWKYKLFCVCLSWSPSPASLALYSYISLFSHFLFISSSLSFIDFSLVLIKNPFLSNYIYKIFSLTHPLHHPSHCPGTKFYNTTAPHVFPSLCKSFPTEKSFSLSLFNSPPPKCLRFFRWVDAFPLLLLLIALRVISALIN